MASKTIKLRAENFINSLDGLSQSEKGKRCKEEVLSLKKEYSINYVRTSLTTYREVATMNRETLNHYLTVGYKAANKIKKAYNRKLSKQHKELKKIVGYEGAMLKAKELLSSEKYSDIVCALCFLTGRRMSEILKTAKFTSYKRYSYMLTFKGQLKKRDIDFKYPIYVLGNLSNECKQALKRVRELVDTKNMTLEQVSRKYESVINQRCTVLFGSSLGRCSAHDLRKAYSTICTALYKKPNQSINSFLSSILGHNQDDLNTANSYQKYYL